MAYRRSLRPYKPPDHDPLSVTPHERFEAETRQQGHIADAESLERRLVNAQTRILGANHADTLASISELAFTLCMDGEGGREKCTDAAKLNAGVLERQKHVLGPEAHYTIVTMDNQAIMLAASGQLAEAERLQVQALQLHRKVEIHRVRKQAFHL